jgi:hypothetical protein
VAEERLPEIGPNAGQATGRADELGEEHDGTYFDNRVADEEFGWPRPETGTP